MFEVHPEPDLERRDELVPERDFEADRYLFSAETDLERRELELVPERDFETDRYFFSDFAGVFDPEPFLEGALEPLDDALEIFEGFFEGGLDPERDKPEGGDLDPDIGEVDLDGEVGEPILGVRNPVRWVVSSFLSSPHQSLKRK